MITLEEIQKYILKEYGIEFETIYEEPTNYEKYKVLVYKEGKRKFNLEVGYAYSCEDNMQVWSIYADTMDYKELFGFGGAYKDEGTKTIDKIMNDFGFKKINQQLALF